MVNMMTVIIVRQPGNSTALLHHFCFSITVTFSPKISSTRLSKYRIFEDDDMTLTSIAGLNELGNMYKSQLRDFVLVEGLTTVTA